MKPYVVLDEGDLDEESIGTGVLVDVTGKFTNAFCAVQGSAILVRPDSYLAVHEIGYDPQRIAAALEPWCAS